MKRGVGAVGKMDRAVNEKGVRARGRPVQGPVEAGKAQRQAAERDIQLGLRGAKSACKIAEVVGEALLKIRGVGVESFGNFEGHGGIRAGKGKTGSGAAMEVRACIGARGGEAGLMSGLHEGLKCGRLELCGHGPVCPGVEINCASGLVYRG